MHLPNREGLTSDRLDRTTYDDERGELGGYTLPTQAQQPRIQITQKILHPEEVNRARYMPQNPDLIATKCTSGEVLVFDRTKHSSEPDRSGVVRPDIRLVGQTKEGCVVVVLFLNGSVFEAEALSSFGLAWSAVKKGHILGSSEDMTVCHWYVSALNSLYAVLTSIQGCKCV